MKRTLLITLFITAISFTSFSQNESPVKEMIQKIESIVKTENIKSCTIQRSSDWAIVVSGVEFTFDSNFLIATKISKKGEKISNYYNIYELDYFYTKGDFIFFVF
jgi:hypothetical protein